MAFQVGYQCRFLGTDIENCETDAYVLQFPTIHRVSTDSTDGSVYEKIVYELCIRRKFKANKIKGPFPQFFR